MLTFEVHFPLYLEKTWLDLKYHSNDEQLIMTPKDIESIMKDPSSDFDTEILDLVEGSMIGMALGDALGAHVEFRPRKYLKKEPVRDLMGGGTWGLNKGQVKYCL